MVNSIGNTSSYNYGAYNVSIANAGKNASSEAGVSANVSANTPGSVEGVPSSQSDLMSLKRAGVVECATCASRTYQDGSDESVSYKSAAHIDPSSSGAKVMAHEQEHVSNAYAKAAKGSGQVVLATVTLKSAICPECGRSYVSGGVTNTIIKYNENNPYGSNQKSADYAAISGMNVDVGI